MARRLSKMPTRLGHSWLTCTEPSEAQPSIVKEEALKLECDISGTTDFLLSDILNTLDNRSRRLVRAWAELQCSRVSRVCLVISWFTWSVRFYWRRDIQKKAKIMRNVKFPLQLDASDIVTDDLRTQLQAIGAAVPKNPQESGRSCEGPCVVTHKGPLVDPGHYIGWVKRDEGYVPSSEEEWSKFDDNKVSTVKAEKISSMDGGGEDSVAYILPYCAVDL
ncbi:deubiquitinating enzyme [Cryptotrichosporon argae]